MELSRRTSPELSASIFSILTLSWLSPLVSLGNSKLLEEKDLYDINPRETAEHCEQLWKRAASQKKNASAWRLLWECYGTEYLRIALFKPLWLASALLQVYILKALVQLVVNAHDFKWWWGASLVIGMFSASALLSISQVMCLILSEKVGVKIRSTISMAVFNKLLSLKSYQLANINRGEILNLVTSDSQAIVDAATQLHFTWFAIVELFIIGILAIKEAGVSAIPGVVLAVLTQPLQIRMAQKSGSFRARAVEYTDARVNLMDEVLKGIRVIKYNGWVVPFLAHIADKRGHEISRIMKSAYFKSSMSSIRDSIAPLASLATFGTYYAMHNGSFMPATQAFTVLALINVMVRTFTISPLGILAGGEAKIAVRRFQNLLNIETENEAMTSNNAPRIYAEENIFIINGSFSWENGIYTRKRSTTLHDINFTVKKGETVSIYGPVGSGKSSLLLAILGELRCLRGEVFVQQNVAYAPQQPWVFNDTIQQNIIFTNQYDPDRYQQIIRACALEHDISLLVGGDNAEIGERGINLSGGQKSRISLARACYSLAPIILLDDPFSAVDVPTAEHLIQHVLNGIIKDRTIVLVTHSIMALSACNRVHYMENGHIRETPEAAIRNINGTENGKDTTPGYFIKSNKITNPLSQRGSQESEYFEICLDPRNCNIKSSNVTVTEDQTKGNVRLSTWITYANASGGICYFSFVMLFFTLAQGVRVLVDYWLRVWTETKYSLKQEIYMISYASLVLSAVVLSLARGFLFRYVTTNAAIHLHNKMAYQVLRSPQIFFDQNLAGRILNRFSKDQALVDDTLPFVAQQALEYLLPSLGSLIMTAILIPWFLLVFPPLIIFFIYLQRRYIAISCNLKRLEGVSRSPIYSQLSQAVEGIVSVHAYGAESKMHSEFMSLIDANNRPYILFAHLTRWLGVRLDFATYLCVTFITFLVIIIRRQISPGLAGIVLVQCLQATGLLQYGVRQTAEVENCMTSVERIEAYIDLPSEMDAKTKPGIIDKSWPSRGEIEFKEYTMTYRPDLPPVLNRISFKISASERIGILGRTGVGKSSLAASIFRMVENDKCNGTILIDGVNIKMVGLDDLRQSLSVIPQDPILFQGSLRFNLDPFEAYSDTQIWDVLEKVHLAEKICNLDDGGLYLSVVKGGENFSVGQRQLICLARSLLRR